MSLSQARNRMRLSGKAYQDLKEAAERRTGWSYDPRGYACMIVRPLHGEAPNVGVIAYVRPMEDGTGYESIVNGKNPRVPRFPGDGTTAEETLRIVEKWLQDGLEGIAADRARSEANKAQAKAFKAFLASKYGDEEGASLYQEFLASKYGDIF